jgi:phenylpropionate dioxygenase-like ring-hydroxylating dioxygenase large terminal subunit
MLSQADNEYLCRIGPGTAMGNVFRHYWLPAVRSDELPAPDCPPLRVKLLGEELIAYRTTSGAVGLMQNACPHRGASMFFGRNEEEGLRCVYHGWKFDVTGACVDMPSEPAESNFRSKVRARAYPCIERNGIIWAYMGPRERDNLPPLPDIEANLLNRDVNKINVLMRACNWMQGIEGELDTIHAAFLHFGSAKLEDQAPGSFNFYHIKNRDGRFVVRDTDFGASYGCYRPAEDDTYYWRIAHVLFPFYAVPPQGALESKVQLNAYVPMDDEHTLQWEIFVNVEEAMRRGSFGTEMAGTTAREDQARAKQANNRRPGSVYLPQTSGWYGRFRLDQDLSNDYMVDREAQRSGKSFSGIPGVRQQDMAVTETMGPIYRRQNEHLGTSDSMIIRTRRRWIATARALEEQGVLPPGVDDPTIYRQRSGEVILPRAVDWWEGTAELRERFQGHDEAIAELVNSV